MEKSSNFQIEASKCKVSNQLFSTYTILVPIKTAILQDYLENDFQFHLELRIDHEKEKLKLKNNKTQAMIIRTI
jgi:hypothetical protein